MVNHEALCHRPANVMPGDQQVINAKLLNQFGEDVGLHFDRAVKAVALVRIAITDQIRDDQPEMLREHLDTVFPQVPPDWNAVDQQQVRRPLTVKHIADFQALNRGFLLQIPVRFKLHGTPPGIGNAGDSNF